MRSPRPSRFCDTLGQAPQGRGQAREQPEPRQGHRASRPAGRITAWRNSLGNDAVAVPCCGEHRPAPPAATRRPAGTATWSAAPGPAGRRRTARTGRSPAGCAHRAAEGFRGLEHQHRQQAGAAGVAADAEIVGGQHQSADHDRQEHAQHRRPWPRRPRTQGRGDHASPLPAPSASAAAAAAGRLAPASDQAAPRAGERSSDSAIGHQRQRAQAGVAVLGAARGPAGAVPAGAGGSGCRCARRPSPSAPVGGCALRRRAGPACSSPARFRGRRRIRIRAPAGDRRAPTLSTRPGAASPGR